MGLDRNVQSTNALRDIPHPKVLDIYGAGTGTISRERDPRPGDRRGALRYAISCGMPAVKRFHQLTLNLLNAKATKCPDLVVRGVVEPNTMDA